MVEVIFNLIIQIGVYFLFQYSIDEICLDIPPILTKKWGILFSYPTDHQNQISRLQYNSKRGGASFLIIVISIFFFASFADALDNILHYDSFAFIPLVILAPLAICAAVTVIYIKFFALPSFPTWFEKNHFDLFKKTKDDIDNEEAFTNNVLSAHYSYLLQYDSAVYRRKSAYNILKVLVFLLVLFVLAELF